MATGLDVLKVAQSQLGYKESPAGSNNTKYGKEYGLNKVAWCAIFVWWVFKHAGCSQLFYGGGKCAYCPTIADYYIARKQTVSKGSGKAGDIVLFGFGHTNSQHIGIIESKNSDGTYNCIEGNTSVGNNCNGGMVMRRKRYQSQINWIVRPKYEETKPVDKPTGKYSGTLPTTLVKYGSRGNDTLLWQKFLNWYHDFKLAEDGECGSATTEATSIFQLTEGITADGEAGTNTYAKAKVYLSDEPTLKNLCIDASYWQGKHSVDDWKKVAEKCDYAILRASYTSQDKFALHDDSTFLENFKNAHSVGIKCGAYHYSQAITVAEAEAEAEYLCKRLKGLTPDFYVVCDYEFGNRLNSEIGTKASSIANAFCDVVKSYGYKPMIYGNLSMMNNYLKSPNYPVWLAQYNSKCTYKKPYAMWQYTSSGSVNGISGRVDLSYVYEEPAIVAPPKEPVTPTKSTYTGAMPDFVALSGDIISNLAKKCAWPVGTAKKKYAFLTGSPFGSYKAMLNKAYPNRTKWSKRPKAGSSCDVFVGTIARASGADTKYPRGLAEQIKYSSPTLKAVSNVKRGDIVRVSGHTLVVVDINGVLWEAEASYGTKGEKYSKYPAIYSKAKKSYAKVLRCNKAIRSYLQIGDTGAEVKKLQAFLKWYGYTLTVDGEFGQITQGFVKLFQSAEKLTADGQFGTASVAKAKAVER